MNERLVVEHCEDRYRILTQQGALLATTAHRAEAFAFARNRGSRVHLVWERTKSSEETAPRDFSATHGGNAAGRVYLIPGGFDRDRWAWCLDGNASSNEKSIWSGTAFTKHLAIIDLEKAYTQFAAESHK